MAPKMRANVVEIRMSQQLVACCKTLSHSLVDVLDILELHAMSIRKVNVLVPTVDVMKESLGIIHFHEGSGTRSMSINHYTVTILRCVKSC